MIPEQADDAIATAAVNQLEKDIAAGHDHLLMARTASTASADHLLAIYEKRGQHFNPVVIHSKSSDNAQKLKQISARESRIIICVDMFGEGFDLPELKIAALHETHKSLAITLQFTGRFARFKSTIGDATIVANLADPAVNDSLCELYAEDSDWNHILSKLSEHATGEHSEKQEFLEGFVTDRTVAAAQNLRPKMSTVIYRTRCRKWNPQRLSDVFPKEHLLGGEPTLNRARNVAFIIARDESQVEWGIFREFTNVVESFLNLVEI